MRQRLLHRPEFKTKSGKGRFAVNQWQNRERVTELFPFHLMSVRSEGQFNSIIYEEADTYRGVGHRWVLFMGAQDMQRLDLRAGQKINVRSNTGEMRGLELHSFDLSAGSLMAYYPEANVLADRETDPRSSTPAFKSIAVAIDIVE